MTTAVPGQWNSLEVCKLVVSALMPLAVAAVGYFLSRRLKTLERAQEEETARRESRFLPHIQFEMLCNFFPVRNGQRIVHFILVAKNCGYVKHILPHISLRVLGIKDGTPLQSWTERAPRAYFPDKLIPDIEVVPAGSEWLFVEPGVTQRISYVALLPAEYSLLLARAKFDYDDKGDEWHSVEEVFSASEQSR